MTNGEKSVNPLRDEASLKRSGKKSVNPLCDEASLKRSGNQKKKTHFVGLFFLTGLRPKLPLGQCPPSKPYTL